MPTTSDRVAPGWPQISLAVTTSALALYFSTGAGTVWPLAWVAPAPILALSPSLPGAVACSTAFVAWGLGGLSWWTMYAGVFGAATIAPAILAPALMFTLGVVIHRRALGALGPSVGVFAFPSFWAAYEFLLSRVSPHGTAGSYAYTQAADLPLLQVVSIGGLPALSFLVMLAPSTAAVVWIHRRHRPAAARAAVVPLVLLAAALVFGLLRLAATPDAPRVRVGLVASDDVAGLDEMTRAAAYAHWAGALAADRAEVVVLPEKLARVSAAGTGTVDSVRRLFSEAAARGQIPIVVGLDQSAPRRNVAVAFGSDGLPVIEYAKRHLVPGFEASFKAGTGDGRVRLPGGTFGVAICKDMDFVDVGRSAGRAGVQLMLVPAWDFVRDGRLHARMAVVRGVENGFAVARSAREGVLTLSDGYGRILAEEPTTGVRVARLVGDVPLGPGGSFYARHGDWFAWAAVALALVLGVGSYARRRS